MKERKDTWFEKVIDFVRDFWNHCKIREPTYETKKDGWVEIKEETNHNEKTK